ncbi:MAG: TIR domain-containing protein [Bacteroidales bacterium]|nr:TIR domain-containing protein [Bacteroidales bacterium]
MDKGKRYFAFISYKREDEEWAKWLQHKLEHYKLPSNLNGRSDLPKEIRPIFRDKSDLAGGVLAEEINDALENSQYLIVICSPHAAHSEWVSKEVKAFIDMGRSDKIIPFIIGGTAHAQNPEEECFPVTLREMPADQELLGVNINEMGRDAAAVKVVAQMFGLKFDELWQRWEREQKRRRNWIVAASVIGFLLMAGVAGWIWWQYREIKEKDWKMMENQSRFVSEKAQDLIVKGDTYTAQRLLMKVLPDNVYNPSDRPCVSEAEAALRKAWDENTAILPVAGIITASFVPDSAQIITISIDDTLRIWNTSSGQIIRIVTGFFTLGAYSAVFNSDCSQLLISYSGGSMGIWDTSSGELLHTLGCHGEGINEAIFSPDETYIASAASLDSTVVIWNIATEQPTHVFKGHTNTVNSIAYSHDGKYIASASDDRTVRIWDVEKECCLYTLIGHTGSVQDVAYSYDGTKIVSSSMDKSIIIWDAVTGHHLKTINGHDDSVNTVVFSPDNKQVVSTSNDKTVRVWDVETGLPVKVLKGHTAAIRFATYSSDGKRIISGSYDNSARLWNVEPHSLLYTLNALFVSSTTYYRNNRHIVYEAGDKICVLDIMTGEILREFKINSRCPVAFSPDGKLIAYSTFDKRIGIYNTETDEIEHISPQQESQIEMVSFSLDGKSMVSASTDVKIWNAITGQLIHTLDVPPYIVRSSVFSPDGKLIVTASDDNTVRTWDAKTGQPIHVMKGHKSIVKHAVFSPDGKLIASASWDKKIIIWDTYLELPLHILEGHADYVNYVSFSHDGKYIASASSDNTIRIWDVLTGNHILTLYGHTLGVISVSFSPNDRNIVSVSDDGAIRIWDFPPLQELLDQTRERFKDRPLTPEERRKYYLE